MEAHVFQHHSGVQAFIYHCETVSEAQSKLAKAVSNVSEWIYLCKKISEEVY